MESPFFVCFIPTISLRGPVIPHLHARDEVPSLVGGWVCCDFLPPLILLIFRYVNKLDVLVTNMVVKVVNGF